jgi:hypothetical protein
VKIEHVLALDLALQTGWSHSCGYSGTQSFHDVRGDSPGMRFVKLRAWLVRMMEEAPFQLIVYEQAGHHISNAATHSAHGFISTAEAYAAERGIEITSRSPSAIKKYALGETSRSNSHKGRMLVAADNRWPNVEFIDDNHVDAHFLLHMVMEDLGLWKKKVEGEDEKDSAKEATTH